MTDNIQKPVDNLCCFNIFLNHQKIRWGCPSLRINQDAERGFLVLGLTMPECLIVVRLWGGSNEPLITLGLFIFLPEIKKSLEVSMSNLRVIKEGEESVSDSILCAEDVCKLMKFIQNEDREKLYVLHLDTKRRLIGKELVSIGTLNESHAHPREVFKAAIINNTHSIICVHNHPSGDSMPSAEDILTSKRLKDAGTLLGIPVIDHVVIGSNKYMSLNTWEKIKKPYDR